MTWMQFSLPSARRSASVGTGPPPAPLAAPSRTPCGPLPHPLRPPPAPLAAPYCTPCGPLLRPLRPPTAPLAAPYCTPCGPLPHPLRPPSAPLAAPFRTPCGPLPHPLRPPSAPLRSTFRGPCAPHRGAFAFPRSIVGMERGTGGEVRGAAAAATRPREKKKIRGSKKQSGGAPADRRARGGRKNARGPDLTPEPPVHCRAMARGGSDPLSLGRGLG